MRNNSTTVLIQSLFNKYTETVENTIFELVQIANCTSLSQLPERGYELKREKQGINTKVSLWLFEKHVITYTIFIESKGLSISIKRERKVNNLDPEIEEMYQ